jgi:hypothetical protein
MRSLFVDPEDIDLWAAGFEAPTEEEIGNSSRRHPLTVTLRRQTVVSLQGGGSLIFHPKGRTVFRLTLAPIIEPRCRYVSMPKPLLNLGDIGIVGESVRCRCGPQRMHTEAVDRR